MTEPGNAATHTETPRAGQGVTVARRFTEPGVHPFDAVEWEIRDAVIGDPENPAFEQRGVEFPATWSQNATNIVAQKYCRGRLGPAEREWSVKHVIGRVARAMSRWGGERGYASAPASCMRGADAWAGTIKSGGKTRRAAKMVVLDVDHPDILDFIWCKAREEEKAAALRDAGFDMRIDGDGFTSIQYQNANNSVRVTEDRKSTRLNSSHRCISYA